MLSKISVCYEVLKRFYKVAVTMNAAELLTNSLSPSEFQTIFRVFRKKHIIFIRYQYP